MKKIIVISDTHIPNSAKALPPALIEEIKNCDLCLHAGDYVNKEVIDLIKKYTDFLGVCGNMDSSDIKKNLPEKKIIKIEEATIAITHGSGSYFNIEERIKKIFSQTPDIYIYGHTHKAICKKENGIWWLNPGSPTDTIFASYQSFGVIKIDKKSIEAEVVKIG